jgi:hypothetical protein
VPWVPLKIIQEYVGVQTYITKDNFQFPPEGGLPCFSDNPKRPADCLGEGKGRTMDKRFHQEVNDALHALFKPFDDYFAKKVLDREIFSSWDFGLKDDL